MTRTVRSRSPVFTLFTVLFLTSISFAFVGCTPSSNDPSIGRQLSGNQAILLSLQNSGDINDMYLPYNGQEQGLGKTGSAGTGVAQIGELNLLLQNRGGSSSAGAVYISGYDQNLIEVASRAGEIPVNGQQSTTSCVRNLVISDNGQYDVMAFCQSTDGLSVGGRVTDNGVDVTVGNLPIGDIIRGAVEGVTGENVGWLTNSLFNDGRVDCSFKDGGQACRIMFGNMKGDPNRALYGFLLLNTMYDEIATCKNGCRIFPDRFSTGQVLYGVSPEYPAGDALYMNYDIFVRRERWPTLLNEFKQRFQITACYYYTTTITPSVCVDPDPSSTRSDPCDGAAPLVWKGSQGAPIAVTRIQPRSVPGGTIFDIELKHMGSGQFWQPGSLDQCSPYNPGRPDPSRKDVVQLLDARVAGELQALRCTPTTPEPSSDKPVTLIRFQNGIGHVSCYYSLSQTPLQTRQAFQTALTLEFGYLYQNIITKDVVIHRI